MIQGEILEGESAKKYVKKGGKNAEERTVIQTRYPLGLILCWAGKESFYTVIRQPQTTAEFLYYIEKFSCDCTDNAELK